MSNLIGAEELRRLAGDPDVRSHLRIVDVRFSLADPDAGRRAYDEGHLPGAVYLDLDRDLSRAQAPGTAGGRHPLPPTGELCATLGRLGIGAAHRVVAYDDAGGAIASRLWWMLRYLGHGDVRLLDGGVQAWKDAGGALVREAPDHPPTTYTAAPRPDLLVDRDALRARLDDGAVARGELLLIDARAADRFRGEREPLDPVAGHIPGARCLPFAGNLDGGAWRRADALRARYAAAEQASEVVVYCGSGVTACHDILALEEAGHTGARLYVGSWSDWCAHDGAPVARGD